MILVKPSVITPVNLLSSNLPEFDNPEYVPATNYVAGDLVSHLNKNWEALGAFSGIEPGTDNLSWLDLGATNRWACFDGVVGTQTEALDEISFSLQSAGIISCIAFLNLEASSVEITITDDYEGVIYSSVNDVSNSGIDNWFDYFFEDYIPDDALVKLDLPAYAGVTIDVSILSQAIAKCGIVIIGNQQEIGQTQYGLSVGITDYSRKDVSVDGIVSILERGYSDWSNSPIEIDTNKVPYVKKLLTSVRGVPCLYLSSSGLTASYVFGFFKDLSIVIPSAISAKCNLEIEGII